MYVKKCNVEMNLRQNNIIGLQFVCSESVVVGLQSQNGVGGSIYPPTFSFLFIYLFYFFLSAF